MERQKRVVFKRKVVIKSDFYEKYLNRNNCNKITCKEKGSNNPKKRSKNSVLFITGGIAKFDNGIEWSETTTKDGRTEKTQKTKGFNRYHDITFQRIFSREYYRVRRVWFQRNRFICKEVASKLRIVWMFWCCISNRNWKFRVVVSCLQIRGSQRL